jgi:hypothetical protein
MSEIVLRLRDDINLERIVALLSPYIKNAEVKAAGKSWSGMAADDGSLTYLFKDYADDGIREPIVDFGEAAGNEQW